jgi:hypothetical protein
LPTPLADFVLIPIADAILPEQYEGIINPFVPNWLESTSGLFSVRPPFISPLVLDIDGDGVELTRLGIGGENSSTVYFDMDNDGFALRTAWVTGGDGLLALDRNNNGIIDNQSELFGEGRLDGTAPNLQQVQPSIPDGFAALRLLDSNNDRKMNSADAEFNNLKVWIDANVDGKTDAVEIWYSLLTSEACNDNKQFQFKMVA